MIFVPFVVNADGSHVKVDIHPMKLSEAEQTNRMPPCKHHGQAIISWMLVLKNMPLSKAADRR